MKEKNIDISKLSEALVILNEQLMLADSEPQHLVVCGGSALIATGLVPRTTQDVDIVAIFKDCNLADPDPFPETLTNAANTTAKLLSLPEDWLNSGPADLFRMGLPEGFTERLQKVSIGDYLNIYYTSRFDQIHFKLYAAVDRGGYHFTDLATIKPTKDELYAAAKWCTTQDVSEGFLYLLKEFLKSFGAGDVAEKL